MYEIVDKLLLLLCCLAFYLFQTGSSYIIIPVIISVALSSLFLYYDNNRIRLFGILIYAFLCLFFPGFVIFLPLLLYDLLHTKYQYMLIMVPILFYYHIDQYTITALTFTSILLLISYLLKFKTDKLNALKTEFYDLRDSSTAMSLLLEKKNQSILKNQDYEINLATLNERNRISKEIHDNIGHLLSRALLQVGALLTISGEELTKEGLTDLKTSLSEGMDQIRNSIHNMYDESIDLYSQLEQLIKDFTFCPLQFEYDINITPQLQLKYCILGITKEALANVMRHSNATKVTLILREHPAMYQLVIHDNGRLDDKKASVMKNAFENQNYGEGMGLRNIYDRVKSFDGNLHASVDSGFKLFITFPKAAVKPKD